MLPRKYKLKRDNDFKKVFKQGRYSQGSFIRIKFLKNGLKISRFAFVVGLKISKKAVQRNRVRRQLEEVVRLAFDQIKTGFDLVILVEPDIIKKDYQAIEQEMISLLERAKLFN